MRHTSILLRALVRRNVDTPGDMAALEVAVKATTDGVSRRPRTPHTMPSGGRRAQ